MTNAVDAAVTCTLCGKVPPCSCWAKCWCGWLRERGKRCNNPANHGPLIVEKIGCACARRFATREACAGVHALHGRCSCPFHRKDARRAYAARRAEALTKAPLVFVVPAGGAPRAGRLRRALAELRQLAEVDLEMARRALADVEASQASLGFKRRARRVLDEAPRTKEPARAGGV